MSNLANPQKVRPPTPEGSDDQSDPGGDGLDESGSEDYDEESGGPSEGYGEEDGDLPDDENEPFEDALVPQAPFKTLDEEKSHLVMRLDRLRRQGMPGLRKYSVHNDIRDLRAEYKRIKNELDLEASLKFQRRMLMAVVGGLEWANKSYSPFELELDGWSESVHGDLNSYDDTFEELFWKYKDKVSAPPEVKLLMMVGGSAMMFHYTNTLMKAPKLTPEAMAGMQQMFQQMQQQQQPQGPQPDRQDPQAPQDPQEPQAGRPPMRGPGLDMSALMGPLSGAGGGAGLFGMSTPPIGRGPPPPVPSRKAGPKPRFDEIPGSPQSAVSDRLSDVLSDDLSSLPESLDGSEFSGPSRKRVDLGSGGRAAVARVTKKPRAVKNVVVI